MENGYTIPVLDYGFVRYIDNFGTDLRIVESARISYKSPSKGEEQDKKLLFYLYKNFHGSPFEQCNLTFNIKMPIFVMREFVRHRTFRLNEMSGRYVELPSEFYIPKEWRKQDLKNKQGSLAEESWNPEVFPKELYPEMYIDGAIGNSVKATEYLEQFCQYSYTKYRNLLKIGVSREMARMVLPVNLYTEIYVNCDVRNLMNFFTLRTSEKAQWEIQQFAKAMYDIFKELYPWSAEAYEKFKFKLVDNDLPISR